MIRQASSPGKMTDTITKPIGISLKKKLLGVKMKIRQPKEEGDVINYLYIVHQK